MSISKCIRSQDARFQYWHARLAAIGQEQVLAFWEDLSGSEQEELIADLKCLNLTELPALSRLAGGGGASPARADDLAPARVIRVAGASSAASARGCELLSQGKVAAFTVAGGQGTRLGYDGPKGAFPISPVRNKPLFQLFAEFIIATGRRYRRRAPWYIMTSPANDGPTRAFFKQSSYFGMDPADVVFFQQGVVPAFDCAGRILLDRRNRLSLAPDGHGGSLLALSRTGMLDDMKRRGVEYISYFQVDNPLVSCLDPVFIGLHDLHHSEMSSKSLPKADDFERVGNFAIRGGRLVVIEYSDLPKELALARNPDGSRRFDAGSIAIHVLSREFVERLTADPSAFGLPWHRAVKKLPYVDLTTGQRVEPPEPCAVKLEAFVFDALPLANNPIVVETDRAEEFSPVKNATGVDSIETTKRDMIRRAARWLEAAGLRVPRTPAGEPDGVFEVSPLLALDAEQLREHHLPGEAIANGAKRYFE